MSLVKKIIPGIAENDRTCIDAIKVYRKAGVQPLYISFKRTLLVHHNEAGSKLPPEFENFPLQSVQEFQNMYGGLPGSVIKKGGVMFPCYG